MRLTLVTFSGASESDQESIIMSTAGSEHMDEEEIDESLLDDNEEEAAEGAKKDKEMAASSTGNDDSTKEVVHNAGSVGSLATSFMLNVTVGSNEVFAPPKIDSRSTSRKKTGQVEDQHMPRNVGLPREYEMVRAARRNWLASTPLSIIGPPSRKSMSSASGFHTGNLVVEGDSRHLSVQHYHSLKDKLNIAMSFVPQVYAVCDMCREARHPVYSPCLCGVV